MIVQEAVAFSCNKKENPGDACSGFRKSLDVSPARPFTFSTFDITLGWPLYTMKIQRHRRLLQT